MQKQGGLWFLDLQPSCLLSYLSSTFELPLLNSPSISLAGWSIFAQNVFSHGSWKKKKKTILDIMVIPSAFPCNNFSL